MADKARVEALAALRPRRQRPQPGKARSALAACLTLARAALACAVFAGLAHAAGPAQPLAADPQLEARVIKIASELRCLVCQNQTIADSHADLAVDLRNQVREMLRQGKTQQEVVAYMTARYGDFVLYRPPMKESTALLWLGPALLFAGGFAMLVFVLRRRARAGDEAFEPDPGVEDDPEAGPAKPSGPAARATHSPG